MASPRPTLLLLLLLAIAVAASSAAQTAAAAYDPAAVDWASVVDACAAAFRFERRLGSFALRSSFHDAGSLTPECAQAPNGHGCGGADGSMLVTEAEQLHPNNRNELFAANTAKVVLPIAKKFGAGVADTLYVCALVAPSVLRSGAPSAGTVRQDPVLRAALEAGFKVGRVDRAGGPGNDPGLLPVETLDLNAFTKWFGDRGLDLEDAAALLGVHALLRPKGCFVEDKIYPDSGLPKGCNPFVGAPPPGEQGPFRVRSGSCPMVSMLRWSNEWFNDLCGINGEGGFTITDEPKPTSPLKPGDPGFSQQVADAVCGYRTDAFRADAIARQQTGSFVTPPNGPSPTIIEWQCPPATGCVSNPRTFFFTQNDAHLGDACRAGLLLPPEVAAAAAAPGAEGAAAALSLAAAAAPDAPAAAAADAPDAASPTTPAAAVQALMESATLAPTSDADVGLVRELTEFFLEYTGGSAGLKQWNIDYARAYARMSELGATWVEGAFSPPALAEYCPSGWVHARVGAKNQRLCARRCGQVKGDCPDACRCATAGRARVAAVVPATGPFTEAP